MIGDLSCLEGNEGYINYQFAVPMPANNPIARLKALEEDSPIMM